MKRNQTLKQAPLLKDHAFMAVVSNVPMPWLAPLGRILLWLIAGVLLDAFGLCFHCWFYVSCADRLAGVHGRDSMQTMVPLFAGS
jgi:hypothetical protein